jgi:biopolymer transport protein ExbB/TolQ
MIQFFMEGGQMMWFFLIIALLILFLSIKKAIQLFGKQEAPKPTMESGINAIVFWGAISAIFGFFSHYLGVYYAMIAISQANDISPAIVAYGYSMSLITILTGLMIFILSAIIWFVLRWRYKQISTLTS